MATITQASIDTMAQFQRPGLATRLLCEKAGVQTRPARCCHHDHSEDGELLAQLDVVVFKRFAPATKTGIRPPLEVLDGIREQMAVKTVAEFFK